MSGDIEREDESGETESGNNQTEPDRMPREPRRVGTRLAKILRVLEDNDAHDLGDGKFKVCCPAHEDHQPSLSVTIGRDRVLIHCFSGCDYTSILAAWGLEEQDLFLDGEGADLGFYDHTDHRRSTLTVRGSSLRNRVYRDLIAQLELHEEEREGLKRRGLSDEVIDRNEYRSLRPFPVGRAVQTLREKYGDDQLLKVPGFVMREAMDFGELGKIKETIRLTHREGLLIPVRNRKGQIVACQIRNSDEDYAPKYVWLSSSFGESSGSPIHVPLGVPVPSLVIRVTEGPLKADVIQALDPDRIPTIGVAGVSAWRAVVPLLKKLGAKTVRVAFDSDWEWKDSVGDQLNKLEYALLDEGYEVEREVWDKTEGKGLDDVLATGGRTERQPIRLKTFEEWLEEREKHTAIAGTCSTPAPVGDDGATASATLKDQQEHTPTQEAIEEVASPVETRNGAGTGSAPEVGRAAVTRASRRRAVEKPTVNSKRPKVEMYTAADLVEMTLSEPKWAVQGIVPEGLTILAGKPKLGKSWAALNMAVAISGNKLVFGSAPADKGDVLYLALEDNPRRLKARLEKVLGSVRDASPRLILATRWPRQDKHGLKEIEKWLDSQPEARLVIVDTWARFKPARGKGKDRYEEDYQHAVELKALADQSEVAVLVLHHARKMAADDALDEVSGSNGLTGAADTILVLRRDRTEADATLLITGRDVEEQELALRFDPSKGAWRIIGTAAEYGLSKQRREILTILQDAGMPMKPAEIAKELGKQKADDALRQTLRRMVDDGQLVSKNGDYSVPA
jgi:hypothetical protein